MDTTTRQYDALLGRGRHQWGERFDSSDLDPRFARYYGTGQRIKVRTVWGDDEDVRTGTVGVTTGWKPAFLLMHRSSDHGSSDVLGARDEIVAVQHGRYYIPVSTFDGGSWMGTANRDGR